MTPPLKIVISGACSPVAYSLTTMIGCGDVFGENQSIHLVLFELPQMTQKLNSFVKELQECAFPLLKVIEPIIDIRDAYHDVHAAFMFDGHERVPSQQDKCITFRNIELFRERAELINQYANKECRVLVITQPTNTNAYVMAQFAPTLNRENFVAMTRIMDNRTTAVLSEKLDAHPRDIRNVATWGNNFGTITPDAWNATIMIDGEEKLIREIINDKEYLEKELVEEVRNRFNEISAMRESFPSLSIAKATADQMHDWWFGTDKNKVVSMGVMMNGGAYKVPNDIVFSMPVNTCGKKFMVKRELFLTDSVREDIKKAAAELVEEKEVAKRITDALEEAREVEF